MSDHGVEQDSLKDKARSSDETVRAKFDLVVYNLSQVTLEQIGIIIALIFSILASSSFALGNVKPFTAVANWIIWPIYQLILRIIGTTIGIGLGLGLASNVYDQLEVWRREKSSEKRDTNLINDKQISKRLQFSGAKVGSYSSGGSFRQAQSAFKSANSSSSSIGSGFYMEDEQSYASLMKSAGYPLIVPPHRLQLRGQVVRRDHPLFENRVYNFTETRIKVDDPENKNETNSDTRQLSKAVVSMRNMWPTLPNPINEELGRFVEFLLRDFIAIWYSKVDYACIYPDPEMLAKIKENTKNEIKEDSSRMMLYGLSEFRKVPFLDSLYDSMSVIFGNLATRVENVNVFELMLMKWVQVLAHTFKIYRLLRKNVVKLHSTKQQQLLAEQSAVDVAPSPSTDIGTSRISFRGFGLRQSMKVESMKAEVELLSAVSEDNLEHGNQNKKQGIHIPVSEMSMTREFLFSGKLHKAVTFGLDIPSLLFSDGNGEECGVPSQILKTTAATPEKRALTLQNDEMTDDEVLERRLFDTKLIRECEIDYNRVLGHRMVRALIPRSDYSSGIVRTLLTEMMGGCVLTPIMGIFCPEYLNSWIIKGLGPSDIPPDSESKVEDVPKTSEEEGASIGTVISVTGEQVENDIDVTAPNSTQRSIPPEELLVYETPKKENKDISEYGPPGDSFQKESTDVSEKANPDGASPIDTTVTSLDSQMATMDNQDSHFHALSSFASVDTIYKQLARALIDLQSFVDFDECRNARMNNVEHTVQWENPTCKSAVICLVLVIEAALCHGRCTYKQRRLRSDVDSKSDADSDDDFDVTSIDGEIIDPSNGEEHVASTANGDTVEVTIGEYESVSLSQILMELTSDMDAFEERIEADNDSDQVKKSKKKYESMIAEMYIPTAQEQSTMRTLIAAWLHSGQIYRVIGILIKAQFSILAPFYHKKALLRLSDEANGFVRQLIALVDVSILVDTMTVLPCPRLSDANQDSLLLDFSSRPSGSNDAKSIKPPEGQPSAQSGRAADQARSPTATNNALLASTQYMSSSSTPRYLDFHRNESFACSLRSERERRLASWEQIMNHEIYGAEGYSEALPVICRWGRKGATEDDHASVHKELHHIARIFYTGTNMLAIRDAARRQSSAVIGSNNMSYGPNDAESPESMAAEGLQQVSLVTVDTACPRRRLEVPDDDSSFLLRAQPRPLNAVGVHRDQRNHDQSFKCFAATFEEPALPASPGHYTGGKYIRRCLIRYYPIDRTASVTLQVEAARKLDQRKSANSVPDTITVSQSTVTPGRTPFLSAEFLRDRHLCQRWVPKGTTRTQSILASNVMEPTDFTSIPRAGKAIDFVYRMNFYERPMLDLAGKHFTVHDSASLGAHRADSSAMEISDATITIALILLGADEGFARDLDGPSRPVVEMGKDGYPVVWMKFSRKDDTVVEVKPYRTSFVRAALLITAARQEAQLQCLIKCVRDGSAKQASKALTDACLKPTIKLLEYASSSNREKQSILQRDLKLGMNHIDQGQLLRNGLLLPRYPTSILDLTAIVEDVVQSSEVKGVANMFGAGSTVFRIRCVAIVMLIAADCELEGDNSYRSDDGNLGKIFKEEWTIYRTMKEFQSCHKHLKGEVSVAESSGTAGSRLVGAATAAFTATNTVPTRQRQKKLLIPSLSQGPKAAALGVTRKLNAKRKEILDSYLAYLLAPGHLISRSSELLLFLGAFYPFPPNARVGQTSDGEMDPLCRTEMLRTIMKKRTVEPTMQSQTQNALISQPKSGIREIAVLNNSNTNTDGKTDDAITEESEDPEEKDSAKIDMIPSIRSKIDKVELAVVRNRIFELLRYQFGFENASFIRNRVLQALKTASFAVTSPGEFRRMLYKLHIENLNANAIADWIKFGTDMIWPEGVFFTSSPPTSLDELKYQENRAKEILHSSIPSEFRAILGQELTRDGMDIFHEMLQNRLVVKSMFYMMFDLLWIECFPELGDILTGGDALDIDSKAI